jgi:hypothetical protein
MAYRILTLKLDNAVERQEIVQRGQTIKEVFITTMPSGVSIQLALGDGPLMTISSAVSFEPTGDDAINGLSYANPVARPGVTLDVIVVAGESLNARAV